MSVAFILSMEDMLECFEEKADSFSHNCKRSLGCCAGKTGGLGMIQAGKLAGGFCSPTDEKWWRLIARR